MKAYLFALNQIDINAQKIQSDEDDDKPARKRLIGAVTGKMTKLVRGW